MNERLIEIPAEQRIRKVAKELLEQSGYVMRTLISSNFALSATVKVFSKLYG